MLCKKRANTSGVGISNTSVMQSINGASLREHWAAQHCLQEAIVAQRIKNAVCRADAASLDSCIVGHVPRELSRLFWYFFTKCW